jgi:hypothetical protein
MAATILLKDLAEALEMQFDEHSSFLDLDTGRIETVPVDLLREAEDSPGEGPDLPEWQYEQWEIAKRIVSTDRFQSLPTKFDVHEWEIMRNFADSVKSESIRSGLLDAMHGAGAFRHFKHVLRLYKIEQQWYDFRSEALRQIAIEWCEKHNIAWR